MPLMMDDDMEVDINDLFGDGADLPLPSRPPPKELFQRIDELRGSGCVQGIAWSRYGCIASITRGGIGLEFRNLRCNPVDGSWDLTEPTTISPINLNLDGGPLQHLYWSPNGTDLAVIDSAGRISILAVQNSLNKPSLARSAQMDPAEDLHAVVGAFWLNLYPMQQRPAVINGLALKTAKDYRYEMVHTVSFGPSHPNPQRSALICLTTNGILRFLWPSDGKWNESTTEIESVVSSNDLITHASICADRSASLFVVFATATKQLRAIRVAVKWGNKTNDKNVNPAHVLLNPTILVGHLAVTNWMDGGSTDGVDPLSVHSSMVTLSHLQIFPPSPDIAGGLPTLPHIMVVRSYLPVSPSHYNQDTHSIIDRWELRESTQTLHPAFEQLGSRRSNTTQLSTSISFRKLEGTTVNKVVIFVQSISHDRILCFAYGDGSFEYRDRVSLAETFTEGGLDKFTHMSQIGFSYPDEEPCLHVALSPTGCSFVQISCDRKVKWKPLRHDIDVVADPANDIQFNAIVAGLTLSCSTAIMGFVVYDDLLAIAHRYTSQQSFSYDWLMELSRVLKFHVDYSDEPHHDTLIRNPSIQLCLCIQNSLGYTGDAKPRSFGAKLAWISLQIRNCVVLMTMVMVTNMKLPDPESVQKKISGLEDAEAIRMLSGSVRWCLDLMSWIIDSLLNPEDKPIFKSISTSQNIDLKELNNRLSTSNNVALHLLFSSATRSFLTVICRRLTTLDYTARKAMSTAAQNQAAMPMHLAQPVISNSLRRAYTSIATLTSSSIVQVRTFETLLTHIATSVKDAYTTAGLTSSSQTSQQLPHLRPAESSRNLAEQNILFGGPLPAELKSAITHLFTSLLPTLRSEIDLAKLFFHDFSLLALNPMPSAAPPSSHVLDVSLLNALHQNNAGAANERITYTIDIFQRVPIVLELDRCVSGGSTVNGAERGVPMPMKRWRRCARCAAVMEDLTSQRSAVQFLIAQQRRCFCGGNWDIITGRQVAA